VFCLSRRGALLRPKRIEFAPPLDDVLDAVRLAGLGKKLVLAHGFVAASAKTAAGRGRNTK